MDAAKRWVAISDGGSGLEEFLRVNFPRVEVVILDFYHAAEYLGTVDPIVSTKKLRSFATVL